MKYITYSNIARPIFFFLLCAISFVSNGQAIKGKATYITDGDTFHFMANNGEKFKVRLADIDAPESTQPYGMEVKERLMHYINGKKIQIKIKNKDRYGRKIAYVYVEDKDINLQMIKDGYAWWYEYYARDNQEYKKAEIHARDAMRGLWIDPSPINPYEWRNNH